MENIFKITSSEFVVSSASGKDTGLENFPHIVFTGKSNVGKSSVINSILGRKNLARIGNTPGKTRLINFFLVNSSFYFTDLPGYGYAAVSLPEKEKWAKMIKEYLFSEKNIKLAVSILDVRHDPGEHDLLLTELFESLNIPHIILLNKKDKISNNVFFNRMKAFRDILQARSSASAVIPYSAKYHFNRDKVLEHIKTASEKIV